MREFKLSTHNMLRWQYKFDWETRETKANQIIPGQTKVCANKLNYMGVITDITKTGKPYRDKVDYITEVEVLWLVGPRKGTKQRKSLDNLSNFDEYKASIQAHLKEIEDIEQEAAKTGM